MEPKRTRRGKPTKTKKPTASSPRASSSLSSIASKVDVHGGASLNADEILQLQRVYGNQATIGILQRQGIIQREPEDDEDGGGDASAQETQKKAQSDPDELIEIEDDDPQVIDQDDEIDQIAVEAAVAEKTALSAKKGADKKKPNAVPVGPDMDDDEVNIKKNGKKKIAQDTADGSEQTGLIKQSNQPEIKQAKGIQSKDGTKQLHSGGKYGYMGAKATGVIDTVLFGTGARSAVLAAQDLQKAAEGANVKSEASGEGVFGFIMKLSETVLKPALVVINALVLLKTIKVTKDRRRYMKAYKKLLGKDSSADIKKAKKSSTPLQENAVIAAYGYAKTRRGFWLNLIRSIVTAGQIIARLATFLTGGMATLVTEAVNASMGLAKASVRLGQIIKGIYKRIRGTRGKRRLEGANAIVDKAMQGDKAMLQLMVDLEPFSTMFWFKRYASYAKHYLKHTVKSLGPDLTGNKSDQVIADKSKRRIDIKKAAILKKEPKTVDELQAFLKVAHEAGLIKDVKELIADSMKSS